MFLHEHTFAVILLRLLKRNEYSILPDVAHRLQLFAPTISATAKICL